MNTLTLSAICCTLKHVNVRKEGNEEDGLELANDLKFSLATRGDVALRALGAESAVIAAFYDKDDNFHFPAIKAMNFGLEMNNHRLQIEGNAPDFGGVKLKAFVLEFTGPGPEAVLTFQAQIHPTPEEQAMIVEFLREEIVLTITPPDTLPGVAKTGRLDDICPECRKPFTEKDLSVQISAEGIKTPRLHQKCMKKRANRALKRLKRKK